MDSGERTERLRRATLSVLAVATSAVVLWMIADFLMALLLAAILSVMFHPLYRWLAGRFKGRRQLAAAATLALFVLGVILPLTAFFAIVTDQALRLGHMARPWVETTFAQATHFDEWIETVPSLAWLKPYGDDIAPKLAGFAESIGTWAVGMATDAARETATFFLLLFVALYAMYYFLLQGRAALTQMLYYLPLAAADEQRMIDRFVSVARATIKGTVVIGLVQGALGGVAFWVAGLDGAALWGAVMAFLSIVPGVGAALAWVPVVIGLGVSGDWGTAMGLFAWCAGVVGSVDNFMRPWLIGKDTRMPDLVVLVSTLGGLTLFGAAGFVLGPILAALCITLWDLYGSAFRDLLPPADVPPPTLVPAAPTNHAKGADDVESGEDAESGEDVKSADEEGRRSPGDVKE